MRDLLLIIAGALAAGIGWRIGWVAKVAYDRRRARKWEPCQHVIATGVVTEAWCVLRRGHHPAVEHATTLAALESCGYVQPEF
jgi:hypothetical protein